MENLTSAIDFTALPVMEFDEFRQTVLAQVRAGGRIGHFFAVPGTCEDARARLAAVLLLPGSQFYPVAMVAALNGNEYRSLTRDCAAFQMFERAIAEEDGIVPLEHPNLKRLRFVAPDAGTPWLKDAYEVEGDAIHEVAVGPVHAGVIEPGHFRFQCFGEKVYNLEIQLGYQHRGVERRLKHGPGPATIHWIETLAGDTSVGHATTYSKVVELLAGVEVPARAQAIRLLGLELERIANHVGDLGALSGDVAFMPTAAYCGRIRGEYLNMTATICGNRFGRGFSVPGGVAHDIEPERAEKLLEWLGRTERETLSALDLMFDSPSVLDRFENTGVVTAACAAELGLVGVAARASGLRHGLRREMPDGAYLRHRPRLVAEESGDVMARARVRYAELKESLRLVREVLNALPNGEIAAPVPETLPPNRMAAAFVEGWRGEICHTAITGADGKFALYKVADPSLHNWHGLAMALRNQAIADFPICNKSFNLSYCGHDL